jgi:ribosomal-protein-alanine N-acetyltransferase
MTLITARTTLRPVAADDVQALHALWTDPGVRKYLWDDTIITRERAAEVVGASTEDFAAHGFGLWAVHETATGEWIGFCGFRSSDANDVELLYGIWPRYWGQGLATEAARAVLSYAFLTLGVTGVVAATDVPNHASVQVLERLGMQFERRGLLNGLDTVFYRLPRELFTNSHSTSSESGMR